MHEYLVTADEMRAFDNATISDVGIPGVVLMENAGRSTFLEIKKSFGSKLKGLKVAVIAGPGNNGGDGYVISRYLMNHDADVRTYLLAPKAKIKGDALINLNVLTTMGGKIYELETPECLSEAFKEWEGCGLIVDAILGTGLQSDVRSPISEAIVKINQCIGFKVSVDIPSGLDSDTGKIRGVAVRADLTLTYGFRKLGMALYPGRNVCGHVEVIDICIPKTLVLERTPTVQYVCSPDFHRYFDLRSDVEAHKGSFGHVLVVGGSPGKTGAAVMAAKAASRIGAGLVTVATPQALNQIFENKLTEEMTAPVHSDNYGYWNGESCKQIIDLMKGKDCVVLGPGLSTSDFASKIVESVLLEAACPIVLDADALNCIAKNPKIMPENHGTLAFTPHPGEMARLTGCLNNRIQADRIETSKTFAIKNRLWLILKGAATVVASPDGKIFVNSSGNPWMASGGQGDALSGILGGLLAQGLSHEIALPMGVFIHGAVADCMVAGTSGRPVLATDLIERLPDYLSTLTQSN